MKRGKNRKRQIVTDKAPNIPSPVSQGIKAGNLVILSADARDLDGKVIHDDFARAARQTLENARNILEAAGASMDDIVRVDVYLENLDNWEKFNEIYSEFVPKPYPARSISQPARTPLDIPVGMVVMAWVEPD